MPVYHALIIGVVYFLLRKKVKKVLLAEISRLNEILPDLSLPGLLARKQHPHLVRGKEREIHGLFAEKSPEVSGPKD